MTNQCLAVAASLSLTWIQGKTPVTVVQVVALCFIVYYMCIKLLLRFLFVSMHEHNCREKGIIVENQKHNS